MENFSPSTYQQAIFDFVEKGIGNAVVDAKAGSGKTTTAIRALNYIPENKKILFVAFNKDIANEIKRRVEDKPNIKASTFHSLGYTILKENFGYYGVTVNEYKYKTYITTNINELSGGVYGGLSREEAQFYLNNVIKLTDLARYNLCQSKEEIDEIIEKYGLSVEGTESFVVEDVLKWGSENHGEIDYTDMEWFPYQLNLSTKRYKYDWVIIDEAQDASLVQQELVKKTYKRNTRFIAIGDTKQTINAWCGGDRNAFNNFSKQNNTQRFDLPITYRCPISVVNFVKPFEPGIIAAPNAKQGKVMFDVSPYKPENGDMVLCRNTIPLTKLYTEFLKKSKKCYIRGADIGKGLITLIEGTKKEMLNASLLNEGVLSSLYKKLYKILYKIQLAHFLKIEDAVETLEFSNFYDSIKTIEILSEGLSTAQQLINRIKSIFIDTGGEGVCLSTVHKAKGLEADNVFILCPSLMPSKLATQDWEIEAERNIQYVAYTRAKNKLCFVDEKLFPPSKGYADASSIIDDLNVNATYLAAIYGKNPLTGERGTPIVSKYSNKSSNKPLVSTKNDNKKKIGANKFKNFLK